MTIEAIVKNLDHRMGFWDCACTDDKPDELCLRCQVNKLLEEYTVLKQELATARAVADDLAQEKQKLRVRVEQAVERAEIVDTIREFKPDAAHINALPAPLRKFIHDVQTICDEAGIIRENAALMDQRDALVVKTKELENERDAAEQQIAQLRAALRKITELTETASGPTEAANEAVDIAEAALKETK